MNPTTCLADLYARRSSTPRLHRTTGLVITPIARGNSGHKSRTSNTNGFRRNSEAKMPGIAAVISPLVVPSAILLVDLPMLLLTTLLVLTFLYVSRRGIRVPEAVTLLLVYFVIIPFLFALEFPHKMSLVCINTQHYHLPAE